MKLIPEYKRNTIYFVDAKQTKFSHLDIQRTQRNLIKILLNKGFKVTVFTKEPGSWEAHRNLYLFITSKISDIWMKDYCPLSLDNKNLVSFIYSPDYYKYKQKFREKLLTSVFTEKVGYNVKNYDLVIEGGNLVFDDEILFITEKVFKNNNINNVNFFKKDFKLNPIVIPQEMDDFVGHVDGIIRILPDKRILIPDGKMSDYEDVQQYYKEIKKCVKHLKNYKVYEIPFVDYEDKKYYHNIYTAENCYMNFILLPNIIILPTYSHKKFNNKVVSYFKKHFKDFSIYTVNSVELSKYGGSLNCITGTI